MKLLEVTLLGVSLVTFLSLPGAGQEVPSTGAATADHPAGVIVEKITRYSEAEKAGLAAGDRLLRWERGNAQGVIGSPFDLMAVEIEQAPRGPVTIHGLRLDESRSWTLGQETLGIDARPNLPARLMADYLEASALADSKRASEAAAKFRIVALQAAASERNVTRAWILFRIARFYADIQQWQRSNEAYQEAIDVSGAEWSELQIQLLISWAKNLEKQGEWAHAEKNYLQAIEKGGIATTTLEYATVVEYLGMCESTRGNLANAENYYRQALKIREETVPGTLSEATSFYDLGVVKYLQNKLDESTDYHQRSLALRQKLAPDSLQIGRSFMWLGNVALARSDLAEAKDYYQRALAIAERQAPDTVDVANNLTGLGCVAYARGDLDQEDDYFTRALAINEKLAPDSLTVAMGLHNLGVVAFDRGNLARAEQLYRRSRDIKERLVPGSLNLAATLNNLGNVAFDRGDLTRADHYYKMALSIRQKLAPDSPDVALSLNNLGIVAYKQGAYARAADYHHRSLAIFEKVAPGSPEVARNWANLGRVERARGDLTKAEKFLRRALVAQEKIAPVSVGTAMDLNELAQMLQDRGHLDAAEQHYDKALAIWKELAPDSTNQANALAGLASIYRRRGQWDRAAQMYGRALDTLEKQTSRLGGEELARAEFRGLHEDLYKDYVDLLIAQHKTDSAFEVLERSRARTLLEMLTSAHLNIQHGVAPELLGSERSLKDNIRAKTELRMRVLGEKHTNSQIAAMDEEIEGLRERYQVIKGQIQATSPAYAALTQPQSLTTLQVQQMLDPDTVLLEYSFGKTHSHVFVVTRDSVTTYKLPPGADIEALARKLYDSFTQRNRATKAESPLHRQIRLRRAEQVYKNLAAQLSRMVLAPAGGAIRHKRLLVVNDGALFYIPFSALPEPGRAGEDAVPLMMGHEVINLPSASVLAVLRRQESERNPAAKTLAVIADPVFSTHDKRLAAGGKPQVTQVLAASQNESGVPESSQDSGTPADQQLTRSMRDVGLNLTRLPFTRREADAIISLAPINLSKEALDFEATRATATSPELAQYRIIHFATHGLLDSQHPELSGLVLSLVDKQGRSQSGFLGLEDIYNLNLPADLVVLSACETGLGKEISGEGLIGLTRGFMYAGAARVVASLWSVSDMATAELMKYFYQGMLRDHLSPAAALRRAQIQMWKQRRWRSPYYWAGFQIQGDWN